MLLHYLGKLKFKFSADVEEVTDPCILCSSGEHMSHCVLHFAQFPFLYLPRLIFVRLVFLVISATVLSAGITGGATEGSV